MQNQYRTKPRLVTAIAFAQLVAHGIEQCKADGRDSSIVNGMPWSFSYDGHPVTHEHDDCYIISGKDGSMKMGRHDMLVTDQGNICPVPREVFLANFERRGGLQEVDLPTGDVFGALEPGTEDNALQICAPLVTPEQIEALMARIEIVFEERLNGSTITLAHALLDGEFYLATGMSNCVSPANYNADKGRDYATDKAKQLAREKLWELEGYRLRCFLQGAAPCRVLA